MAPLQYSEVCFDFRFTRPAVAAYLEWSTSFPGRERQRAEEEILVLYRASANTSRTQKCAHADKCQYIPNGAISPGSRGWAADNPLRGFAADWAAPYVAG